MNNRDIINTILLHYQGWEVRKICDYHTVGLGLFMGFDDNKNR